MRFLDRFRKSRDDFRPEPSRPGSALERYFATLELALKQRPGVVPEEGLAAAYEHLQGELATGGEALDDEELAARLAAGFGEPETVADAYQARVKDVQVRRGYAPGWRVFCPRCRRSAPAACAGVTRIGAWSWGKRLLAYCRKCRRFRFLRLVRDLDTPALTRALDLPHVSKASR